MTHQNVYLTLATVADCRRKQGDGTLGTRAVVINFDHIEWLTCLECTLRTLLFACTNFSVLVSPCIWQGLILVVLWVQILNGKLIQFTHEEHASNLLKGVLRWQYSSSIK